MIAVISNIVIAIGIIFMIFGVIGILKYKDFYTRILLAPKIDIVGSATIIIGVAIRHGFSFFSLKVLLLMIIMLMINPLISHIVAQSAYLSGHPVQDSVNKQMNNQNGNNL